MERASRTGPGVSRAVSSDVTCATKLGPGEDGLGGVGGSRLFLPFMEYESALNGEQRLASSTEPVGDSRFMTWSRSTKRRRAWLTGS
jgi:hypothetical protein